MVEFYLLTFPRFPLRKKEHKSYVGKNRTHDFRTSRCAAYLLDHSGDKQTLSFRTRHHLCRQGVALASTRRPYRTGGVTGSEGQEGANGVGGGIGVGGGNGDGNTGTWTVMRTGTERERERGWK